MGVLTVIWLVAAVMAGGALSWMSTLIIVRVVVAGRANRRQIDRRALESALVATIEGRDDADRRLTPFVRRARLLAETLLDLLSLVRGRDREVVLGALQRLGAPDTLRARLNRGSLAGRRVCLEALAAFPGPETMQTLRDAAERGAPIMRLTALRSLFTACGDLPLGTVLKELESGRLRANAVVGEFLRELVACAPTVAAAELRHGLLPEEVQLMLLDGLASAGDYNVLPTLQQLARAPSAKVRSAAVQALGALHHPAAEPQIRAGLADPDWAVRGAAAEAAGAVGLRGLTAELSTALSDPVWRVRFLAAGSLLKLGVDGRTKLAAAAKGKSTVAAEAARHALAEHGGAL